MIKNGRENNVWVENLYEGIWLLKIRGSKLLGYLVRMDSCNYTEDERPYEEGLIPTFGEYAKEFGLEPKRVKCVFTLFEDFVPTEDE